LGKKARPDPVISNFKSEISNFLSPMRAETWWEFKTPVFLGIAYLAACAGSVPLEDLWPQLLKIVAALVPLASFVCVINDITDLRDDLRAGKSNTMAGKSLLFKVTWLIACVLGGAAVSLFLIADPLVLALYLANCLAFTLYSVPPFRLKIRGLAGVLADAAGGSLLPALWSAWLVFPRMSATFDVALAIWAFCFGLRGILYHQAGDLLADREAGVRTFAARIGSKRLEALVCWVVFPLEVLALAWMGFEAAPAAVVSSLLLYLGSQFALWRWLRIQFRIACPTERSRMALLKYYQLWLPLGMIAAMSFQNPVALLFIPAHAVLFPDTWKRFSRHWSEIRHNIQYPPDWKRLGR
jgi:4-hydroxybenzoate polyprenyltransferase